MISFVLGLLVFRLLPGFNAACSSWDCSCWEYGSNYAGRGGSNELGDGTEYMRGSGIWRSVLEILYYFTDLVQKVTCFQGMSYSVKQIQRELREALSLVPYLPE